MKLKLDGKGRPVARSILGDPLLFETYKKKIDKERRKNNKKGKK
jgi:hypothetical protein